MNGDEVLETDENVEPGALPSYDGETPTKDEDDDYTYEFIGWTCGPNFYTPDELPIVDGDTTYVATFESTPKHQAGYYVVGTMTNWKIDDNYLLTKNTEAEGDEFMLNGAALTSTDAFKVVKYEAVIGHGTPTAPITTMRSPPTVIMISTSVRTLTAATTGSSMRSLL